MGTQAGQRDIKKLKAKVRELIRRFRQLNPTPTTQLHYRNPYELVVATVLSAQCTDARVNQVTPEFFRRYPTVHHLASATPEEVARVIKSISYPNNKATHLVALARKVIKDFGGKIPESARELMSLPGVGRKSAHVIASTLWGEPVLGVDTHVFRVGRRLGLHNGKTPLQAEKQIRELIPERHVRYFHHWLILHGRYICKARKPECHRCFLTDLCVWFKENVSVRTD